MNEACNGIFFAPPPGALGRGQKIKYHLISITKSISKIFYTKLCVLSCPRSELFGCWGCPGGQKIFKHGHVAYQIEGDDKQNRMQVKFLP